MTKMIYMVVLILMQFVLGAQAQNLGQCLDNLERSIKAGGNVCSAEEEFIRCYFVALNIPTSSLSETDLTNMKNILEKNLTAVGVHCDFDMMAIMKKVNEDENNSATRTTQKPTDYDGASTEGDCINIVLAAFTQAGNFSCPLLTPYVKCLIRVTGIYKYDASNDAYSNTYSYLETQLDNFARSYSLNCTFGVKELSEEVAREQKSKNSDYDGASTEGDCINAVTAAITQTGKLSCPLLTPYVKCLIRVTGLYEYANNDAYSNEYSSMETKLENFARSYGLNCIFDVKELSKEVAREQKSKNSEPGLHTSVRGKMSFYALAVAAWICSYYFL